MCADHRLVYLAEAPQRNGKGGRLSAREPRSGRVARTLADGGAALSSLLVTSDEHVWTGSFDGLLRVARKSGQPLHEARAHASCIHALAEGAEALFSSGGDFLVRALP